MTKALRVISLGLFAVIFSASVAGVVSPARADEEATVKANLAKLSPDDRSIAEAQKSCAIQTVTRLGAMGVPMKVMIEDQPVLLCCGACRKRAFTYPKETLEAVKKLKEANAPKQKT